MSDTIEFYSKKMTMVDNECSFWNLNEIFYSCFSFVTFYGLCNNIEKRIYKKKKTYGTDHSVNHSGSLTITFYSFVVC